MGFFFYVIRSEKDGSYYKGQTGDLEDRLKRHSQGRSVYTRAKAPWKLVYVEHFENRQEATRREAHLKSPAGWSEWKEIRERMKRVEHSERGAAR